MTKSRGEKKKQVENGSSLFFLHFPYLKQVGFHYLSVKTNLFIKFVAEWREALYVKEKVVGNSRRGVIGNFPQAVRRIRSCII